MQTCIRAQSRRIWEPKEREGECGCLCFVGLTVAAADRKQARYTQQSVLVKVRLERPVGKILSVTSNRLPSARARQMPAGGGGVGYEALASVETNTHAVSSSTFPPQVFCLKHTHAA